MSYKAVFILAIIVATGCTENVFYRYLGCYKNSDSDPAMGTPITDDLMTNEFCADYCYGIGQIFAANEEGDRCFCGINYMKHGPRSDDECDTGCPGNSSQTCGGVHRMSVYEKVVPSAYPNAAMVGGPRGVETKFQIANSWITSDVSPETTKYARILEAGSSGWSPGSGQTGNWLQINMHSVYLAAGVVTQGDATKNKWVTSFMVIYSVDGVVWNSAISMNETTIFNGHNQLNKDTPIINQFYNMVKAKYIRFVTVTCEWACNLRVEVLVNEPLGMETKDISDDNIMVDSVYNDDVIMYGALHARLKNTLGSGCWMPKHNGDKLTIDLLAMTLIRAIAVQGCSDIADSSPDAFIIMYGETGIPDTEYTGNNGNTQNFTVTANNNEEVSVIHFDVALFARSIAILPFKINGNVGIRLELYGYRTDKTSCVEWLRAGYKGGLTYWVDVDRFGTEPARRKICHGEVYPLGMMSGNIRSGQLSESSSTSEKYTADAARLNYADSSYDPPPAWMPQTESSSFIGINLIYRTILRMIATQGQGTAWVKSFYFSYGVDQSPLNEYKEHGFRKEFQANTDEFTIVRNELLYPLRMIRYIKIYPLCWENTVALRMELYGQYLDHPYLNEDYLEFVEGSYIHTLHKLSSPVPKRKIIDGNPYPGNCTDTKTPEVKSYIRVDMPEVKNFMSVSIVNNDDFPEESVKLQATVGVEKQWAENTNCGDMIESLDAGEIGYFMCSDNGNEYINGSTVATAINDPREKHRLCLCEMYAFGMYYTVLLQLSRPLLTERFIINNA
ncbi:uncharacterized protein LOC102803089 [Saccoglossus kowalevskii]|uniref:Uncharacterized protein LOC102803089 n=1 Tax=Saccoglossus kowalevskii TaxID=10224 RepID=A0ABM0LZA3_SACKO|nr:PREDICTED: uncharacterized protein LOC102803089 [Saccoglossus kowalevskii]